MRIKIQKLNKTLNIKVEEEGGCKSAETENQPKIESICFHQKENV